MFTLFFYEGNGWLGKKALLLSLVIPWILPWSVFRISILPPQAGSTQYLTATAAEIHQVRALYSLTAPENLQSHSPHPQFGDHK